MVCLLCSINWLPFTLKHSGLLGSVILFFPISLTYQVVIGQNGKEQIKLPINQLVSSIMIAKLAFECGAASGSCGCGGVCVCVSRTSRHELFSWKAQSPLAEAIGWDSRSVCGQNCWWILCRSLAQLGQGRVILPLSLGCTTEGLCVLSTVKVCPCMTGTTWGRLYSWWARN